MELRRTCDLPVSDPVVQAERIQYVPGAANQMQMVGLSALYFARQLRHHGSRRARYRLKVPRVFSNAWSSCQPPLPLLRADGLRLDNGWRRANSTRTAHQIPSGSSYAGSRSWLSLAWLLVNAANIGRSLATPSYGNEIIDCCCLASPNSAGASLVPLIRGGRCNVETGSHRGCSALPVRSITRRSMPMTEAAGRGHAGFEGLRRNPRP